MKWLVITIIILTAALSTSAGLNPTLTAMGEGTVTVPADSTAISVSVRSDLGNASQDDSAVQERLDRAIDALKAAGVSDGEILPGESSGVTSFQSTSRVCRRVNNSTECENSTQQMRSIERSALVRINGTDESRIERILDAAASVGAEAHVSGYWLSDPSQAQKDARSRAVSNARENAMAMASIEGLSLGRAVDITELANPVAGYEGLIESSQTGMVRVTSYVMVTYELSL